MAWVAKGVTAYGGPEVQQILSNSGMAFAANIVKMFIKLGETVAEAGVPYSASGGQKDSYVPNSEGGKFSVKGVD